MKKLFAEIEFTMDMKEIGFDKALENCFSDEFKTLYRKVEKYYKENINDYKTHLDIL